MSATYRLMDLFAGCGGMTQGFVDIERFIPTFAVEVDGDAADTYEENFGEHLARSHEGAPLPIERVAVFEDVDVIIGGPPCQGFSPLNMRGVGLERRGLWFHHFRAIREANPMVFVMENVPQLLGSAEYAEFRDAVEALGRGYQIREDVLNAVDYGVPQTRKRAIIVGSRVGPPPWPGKSGTPKTFRDAVEGLPLEPDNRNWHRPRNPRPMSIVRYKAVPPDGGNRFQMQENLDRANLGEIVPACWRNKPTGTTDVFGRLWWDKPAYTIRTEFFKPEKGRYLHPSEHRPITVREAARCMSFEDDFVFPKGQSMTSIAKQIGNAVPPKMARAIATAISTALDRSAPTSPLSCTSNGTGPPMPATPRGLSETEPLRRLLANAHE